MPPVIDREKCTGCHKCVEICPLDVFGWQDQAGCVPTVRYPRECWHCNACVLDCPAKAVFLRIPAPAAPLYMDVPEVSGT